MDQSEVPFKFENLPFPMEQNYGQFVIDIPNGLQSKVVLMAAYKEKAELPNYFGSNWDALSECLCDFSWISQEVIVISHRDLPLSQYPSEARIYLAILCETIGYWRQLQASKPVTLTDEAQLPRHELIILFPKSVKDEVASLLKSSED
jgi:Barstar (barnase inhibitor)